MNLNTETREARKASIKSCCDSLISTIRKFGQRDLSVLGFLIVKSMLQFPNFENELQDIIQDISSQKEKCNQKDEEKAILCDRIVDKINELIKQCKNGAPIFRNLNIQSEDKTPPQSPAHEEQEPNPLFI